MDPWTNADWNCRLSRNHSIVAVRSNSRHLLPSVQALPSPAVHVQPAYTIQRFAAAFGVGRSKTYVEISSGRLRTFKVEAAR